MKIESSLQRNLLRRLGWSLAPILICGALITVHVAWRATQDSIDLSLLDSALDLGNQVSLVDGVPVLDLPVAAKQMLAVNNEDRVIYAVRSSSGEILGGDPNLPIQTFSGSETRHRYYDAVINGTPVRAIALRSRHESGSSHVDIAVAQTLNARNRIFTRILGELLIPEVLLAAVAFTMIWFGVRRGLAPAEHIRDEIASRSPHDLHPIDESIAPDELRPILSAINSLLLRLDSALGAQRRFIADAAHQLRTPLAALRARLENASAQADGSNRELLEELLAATGRLTRLANQLLSLARAEHTNAAAEARDVIDLKTMVTELAADWVLRAAEHGIELAFEIEPLTVHGNELLIREMLSNLLDNAIRYSPAGGIVSVRVTIRQSAVVIEVEDGGPGIPQELRNKVQQRFYRLPEASKDGCGLGLAIVGEIVAGHGGQLRLSDAKQGSGLLVSVELPVA